MGQFFQDLRFGSRSLVRSPGFAAVALATLALGIGANTAIFSVVEAVLLRPLPFPAADRLVAVVQTLPSRGVRGNGASYLNYADWLGRARSFEHLSAIRMHDYTLTGHGEPDLVTAGTVTSNLFRVLEDTPLLGRTLTAIDDDPAAPSGTFRACSSRPLPSTRRRSRPWRRSSCSRVSSRAGFRRAARSPSIRCGC